MDEIDGLAFLVSVTLVLSLGLFDRVQCLAALSDRLYMSPAVLSDPLYMCPVTLSYPILVPSGLHSTPPLFRVSIRYLYYLISNSVFPQFALSIFFMRLFVRSAVSDFQ